MSEKEDMMDDFKNGLVLRYKSHDGSDVAVCIASSKGVFNSPADGTRPYVDIFEKPMQEALKLLDTGVGISE